MEYKRLFSPFKIKEGLELKNRIVMPAFHNSYCPDGYASDRLKAYYNRRAEGGVAMIILGGCTFDDYSASPGMPSFKDDSFIPGFRDFAEGIHQRGAKVGVQLYHAGRYTFIKDVPEGKLPLAPSAIPSTFTRETPKAMTKEEIDEVIANWAAASVRVQKAGFDAVELIGSAGYLISQFLSPTTNIREDEYGGSWENRMRFPTELVTAVRAAVGPEFPIFMRISGSDFVPGANTNQSAIEFAQRMEQTGIDLLDVTGGWHETVVPQLPGDLPRGGFTYLSEAIKEAVSIPVMISNRINHPAVAEKTLALEKADLTGVGRGMLADPDWPIKAEQGRADEIRMCVACVQGCLSKAFFGKPVECLVNGMAGIEYKMKMEPTDHPQKILVVGAGPGGMDFAIHAAQRGHKVTVWEQGSRIGGQLHLVAAAPAKSEFATLVPYYEAMAKKLEIGLVLGKKATAEAVINARFDQVVLATGILPNTLELDNPAGKIDIVTANQILAGEVLAGKRVVVVGGSSVGCEVAQYLAVEGSLSPELLYFLMVQQAESTQRIEEMLGQTSRQISIVELRSKIGDGFDLGTGWPVMKELRRLGVSLHPSTTMEELKEQSVVVNKTDKEGNQQQLELPCDTLVLAIGAHSNNSLYHELEGKIQHLHLLGDALKVGKAIDAIQQATLLASQI